VSHPRTARLMERLREEQIDYALLSSLASLRYFTGFTAAIETGPSPFTAVAAILLVSAEDLQLFVADSESAKGLFSGITAETFSSYTVERLLGAAADLNHKLLQQMRKLPPGRVGIEPEHLPGAVLEALRSECPKLDVRDISELVSGLRVVKDEEEIEILRECCALCDAGQELARKLARAGMTEIELFAEIRKVMEAQEGGRLPLLADMVSGPRSAEIGGGPTARRMEPGDPIIVDLVPRHKGYWGDSCNTCVVGEPGAEQRRFFDGILEALHAAIHSVRPGLRACDLDRSVRQNVLKLGGGYPHHTGHGLGVTWHEEPRICPYNTLALAPNMVIALEPGIYFKGGWGVRLESVVRVTGTGAEVLSKFQHSL
jgi:Xaa-Pro dipeptidase